MDTAQFAAKLTPPAYPPRFIQRPRLVKLLEQNQYAKVILLLAPAGYGKTILLREWIDTRETYPAWLSLQASDNEETRFFHCLFASLRKAGFQGDFDINDPVSSLLNAFPTQTASARIILDNFHHITQERIILPLMEWVNHASGGQLILASRTPPPLPLSSWRAHHQLKEIGISELPFTLEEIETLYSSLEEKRILSPSATSIWHKTEGWPLGVDLVATILSGAPNDTISGAHWYFSGYFQEEILGHLSSQMQRLLLELSHFDFFSSSLCQAVTSQPLPSENGLFILPGAVNTWRFHPLFREFLLAHPLQENISARELYQQAWQWLEQNNLVDQAIPHALKSGEIDEAARLIGISAPNLLQSGQWRQLRSWLDQLPDKIVWGHPRLCITKLWLLLETYQQNAIQPYLERLEAFLSENVLPSLQSEIFTIRAIVAAMRHKPDDALEFARQAEAVWNENDIATGAYVAFGLGVAYKMGNYPLQAEHWLRQAGALAESCGNAYLAFSSFENLTDLLFYQARLSEAQVHAHRAIRYATQNGTEAPYTAWIHHLLGTIAFVSNSFATAQTEVEKCILFCREWDNHAIHIRGLLFLVQIHLAREEYKLAQELLEEADTLTRRVGDSRLLRVVMRSRILSAIAERNLETARRWWTLLNTDPLPGSEIPHHLVAARLYLTEGQPRHALPALEEAEKIIQTTGFTWFEVELCVLSALTHRSLGQPDLALKFLDRALQVAAPANIRYYFVQAGAPMRELLRRSAVHSVHTHFIGDLLKSFKGTQETVGTEKLTGRELQILRLLSVGFTNRDIADELIIAESTLKRHVANLYSKLGVHSRTQAVAYAQEFHLL